MSRFREYIEARPWVFDAYRRYRAARIVARSVDPKVDAWRLGFWREVWKQVYEEAEFDWHAQLSEGDRNPPRVTS